MRNGFDIYRVGPDRNHQEPPSPWGWTARRGEVPTGETVVQDHDYSLTYTGNDPQLAAAFARGARLKEIVTMWPELAFYPSTAGGFLPDGNIFPIRGDYKPPSGLSSLRSKLNSRFSSSASSAEASARP